MFLLLSSVASARTLPRILCLNNVTTIVNIPFISNIFLPVFPFARFGLAESIARENCYKNVYNTEYIGNFYVTMKTAYHNVCIEPCSLAAMGLIPNFSKEVAWHIMRKLVVLMKTHAHRLLTLAANHTWHWSRRVCSRNKRWVFWYGTHTCCAAYWFKCNQLVFNLSLSSLCKPRPVLKGDHVIVACNMAAQRCYR